MMIPLIATLAALAPPPPAPPAPQGVEYRIEARLDEETDVLHARARLRYTNRSGSTLDTLWLHQHLNAFRPNSAFARRELQFGQRRFQDLGPEDQGFERFSRVESGGREVRPVYPGAPDSTVVGLPLPAPLRPGESVTLVLDWDARLATVPRRQGRRGREFNWAHWYPRIAVFENGRWQTQPLVPQGEFYGEFASYDVTLDLPADQVVAATGVPVEGDPGWERASAPGTTVAYGRDAYPARAAEPLGLLPGEPGPGRKRVRWRAEQVHHFAWVAAPDYRHEGTVWRRIPIHVLYRPPQAADWGNGVVVGRTVKALEWLDSIFGPYRWPQFSVVPRIETPGATEYPMLIMNGSASQGLIMHETAHQYAHGMLANNEFREGWLDEGMADFVTNWFWESQGEDAWQADIDTIQVRELHRQTEPVALPGAAFSNPRTYSQMTYTKGALVLRMLRETIGRETMLRVLRRYFAEHALQHVTEADLRAAVRAETGESYDWFFEQWLHTTKRLDYGVSRVAASRLRDGRWRTRVEVVRLGEAWMPVTLQVGSERRTLTSRRRVQEVTVVSPERPAEVVLDPGSALIDMDRANNRKAVPE